MVGSPPPDWATWEEKYRDTGDIGLSVLAIGRHPYNPPSWAVTACRESYENYARASGIDPSNADNLDAVAVIHPH